MIKNLLALLFLVPMFTFAQDESAYKLNAGGMFFMISAWSVILIWNAVCFTKIISKKK